jgi:hypothetical protein
MRRAPFHCRRGQRSSSTPLRLHELEAELEVCQVLVMPFANETYGIDLMLPELGERLIMLKLETGAFGTAPSAFVDERALKTVPLEHRASNRSWAMP